MVSGTPPPPPPGPVVDGQGRLSTWTSGGGVWPITQQR